MATRTAERTSFLNDIITTAIEGGIGYWSTTSHYQWVDDDGVVHLVVRDPEEHRTGTYAVIHEMDNDLEGGYAEEKRSIDIEVIVKGIQGIITGQVSVGASTANAIRQASNWNDAGEIDSDLADIIVQAGLFESIVYG